MSESRRPVPRRFDGVRAESRQRDGDFVMSGHHCHVCWELYYVEKGSCRFLVDDNIYDLHAGDFIMMPPLTLHYTRYLFGPCRRTVILFRKEDIEDSSRRFMPRQNSFFDETRLFRVPPEYQDQISACVNQMTAEESVLDARTPFLLRSQLQCLLLLCSRFCVFPSDSPADIHTTDQQILQAARFISENYMNPITTADVARAVNFSPNYLSRKFRQEAGIGLHEYLVFVRLHHAALELVSTKDSITAIAFRCGFSDSNYFKDAFKKKYGLTPRGYRKAS